MIRRRLRAVQSLIDQAEYIGRSSPAASERLIDAVEAALKDLERMPGMGHMWESDEKRLRDVRVWSPKEFPKHLIFYRKIDGGIEWLYFFHGAQDIRGILESEQ